MFEKKWQDANDKNNAQNLGSFYRSSAGAEMGDRGHNRHGPKEGAGSPSNTKSPGLRPASIPSGILIASSRLATITKNSSGDEIANVNFFYNIAHVEASAYAH